MDQQQIEQIVGQLYLAIKDLQAQLEAARAEKPATPTPHLVEVPKSS